MLAVEPVSKDGMLCFTPDDGWEVYQAWKQYPLLTNQIAIQSNIIVDTYSYNENLKKLIQIEKKKSVKRSIFACILGAVITLLFNR